MVVTQGHRIFVDELIQLAAEIRDPRLSAIAADTAVPLRVAVSGRRGVGRRTVAAALTAAGVRVTDRPGMVADTAVHVVAEVAKPEDVDEVAAAAASRRPVLVVLNKTDLPGHCDVADMAAATGAPVEPMSALFALAALDHRLDDGLWAALRQLAAHPAGFAERLVSGSHPVPRQIRERLCATLDLSGIEQLLEPARRGDTVAQARRLLRRLSGVDAVVAHLAALGAGVQHRRMTEAVTRLEALAVGREFAARIDEFLTADATVAARTAAAVAAVGQQCGPGEPALRRARRWHAYRDAPIGATERACAADIVRGSLRAWVTTRRPV